MTSKNSFSKEALGLDRKLLWEKMRHSLWAISLFTLILFFSIPVPVIMGVQNAIRLERDNIQQPNVLHNALENIASIMGLENFFIIVVSVAMAMVLSTVMFRYMHNKKQVDFYHSLPVRRGHLFASNFLAGFLSFAGAYLINLLIAVIIVACSGYGKAIGLAHLGIAILVHLVFFFVIYSLCILGHLFAGSTATGVLCSGVLLAVAPAAAGLYLVTMQDLYDHWYLPEMVFNKFLHWCSPVWQYFSLASSEAAGVGSAVLYWLAIGLAFMAFGWWLYKKRPSECAGRAISFQIPASILKYVVVLLCTVAGGLFFKGIGVGAGWLFFGFICGGLISHCVIEIIYHADFKAIFSNIKGLAVFAVLFAVVYGAAAADLFHYDSFVPTADQVQSVSLECPTFETYVDTSHGYYNYRQREIDRLDQLNFKEPENIEAALRMCWVAVNEPNFYESDPMPEYGQWEAEHGYTSTSLSVRYTLKSGRQVYRQYYGVPYALVEENIMTLYDSAEYKQNYYPLYTMDAERQAVAYVRQVAVDNSFVRNPQQVQAIIEALREETLNLKAADLLDQTPVATIVFSENSNYGKDDRFDEETTVMPIYPSFTKTIQLLAQNDAYFDSRISLDQVQRMYLWSPESKYLPDLGETTEADMVTSNDREVNTWSGEQLEITDRATMAKLLQNIAPYDMTEYNPFYRAEDVRLRVVLDENRGNEIEYVYPEGKFPLK